MYQITYDQIKQLYASKNYPFYLGAYNINLFGIRASSRAVDQFNDVLGIAFKDEFGNPVLLMHKATTKPGLYFLKEKLGNPQGTFILIPGHYPKCWMKGKHKGRYDALVQSDIATFQGYRDRDSDGELDYGGIKYKNVTGLNMHTTSFVSQKDKVGAYSAGCQVRKDYRDHIVAMGIVNKSLDLYGKYLSYALFLEHNLIYV